jgi:hypothetical protein
LTSRIAFIKHRVELRRSWTKERTLWLVSFKVVQKKVIEYRKKEKLRHVCQAENQWEHMEDVFEGKNTSDYKLPELLPP